MDVWHLWLLPRPASVLFGVLVLSLFHLPDGSPGRGVSVFTSTGWFWTHPSHNHIPQGFSAPAIRYRGDHLQRLPVHFLLLLLHLVSDSQRNQNQDEPHRVRQHESQIGTIHQSITAVKADVSSIIRDSSLSSALLSCYLERVRAIYATLTSDLFRARMPPRNVTEQLIRDQNMRGFKCSIS